MPRSCHSSVGSAQQGCCRLSSGTSRCRALRQSEQQTSSLVPSGIAWEWLLGKTFTSVGSLLIVFHAWSSQADPGRLVLSVRRCRDLGPGQRLRIRHQGLPVTSVTKVTTGK